MGMWKRGVVVGRTSGKRKVKKVVTVVNHNHHGRSMQRKLRQLQNIISGGRAAGEQVVDMDTLFQRIAVYIFLLESRVKLLKNAYALFGPHD